MATKDPRCTRGFIESARGWLQSKLSFSSMPNVTSPGPATGDIQTGEGLDDVHQVGQIPGMDQDPHGLDVVSSTNEGAIAFTIWLYRP